jgi:hypothetical protein
VNRRQCDIVAYLKEESRFLREQIGDRRLRFTDALGRNTIKRILAEHGLESAPKPGKMIDQPERQASQRQHRSIRTDRAS